MLVGVDEFSFLRENTHLKAFSSLDEPIHIIGDNLLYSVY